MDWDIISDKPIQGVVLDASSDWRALAEKALLNGNIGEAIQNIDKAIAAYGRTLDLLMKLELLCTAGDYEKGMMLAEENKARFEADLTARERKNRLEPALRKVSDWLLRTADELFEAGRFEECITFSRQALTQHTTFSKTKKYKELFEFAWRSSYDEVLRRLYHDGEYDTCIDAVDAALSNYRELTTFGQRGRYRKIRAFSYFRLGEYGKGLWNFFSVPGVQIAIVVLALGAFIVHAGLIGLVGPLIAKKVEIPGPQEGPPTQASNPETSPTVVKKSGLRRAEIISLKLFEVSGEIPAIGARRYEIRFSRQSQKIFVEVHYNNFSYRVADAVLPLNIRFHGPTGELLHEIASTSSPKKEYRSAITSIGWRPDGGWKPGKYVVKVELDGEAVKEATFEVQ